VGTDKPHFALPDLQGRSAIGQGQGPGLPYYSMGELSGTPTTTLLSANMPAHVHTLNGVRVQLQASTATATEQDPNGLFPAVTQNPVYADTATPNVFTGGAVVSGTTDISGGGQPFSIMNPYLVMNYSIALQGIFPSRN
jgi:microcystin-dependent protein